MFKIVIIGGGAAGFFTAANIFRKDASITILEKNNNLLSKVKVSGGGRCNVTHHCFDNNQLVAYYPRGKKELINVFARFAPIDTVKWFESRGVKLKTESDGRMFPVSDSSLQIVQCLTEAVLNNNVAIKTGVTVSKIEKINKEFLVTCSTGVFKADAVVVTSGGVPNENGYHFLSALPVKLKAPLPSLFTFNIPDKTLHRLKGVAIKNAQVNLKGFKEAVRGPVLITHWGLSGPAVIKLSAIAAEWLHKENYKAEIHVNWTGLQNEEKVFEYLLQHKNQYSTQKINTDILFEIPVSLWEYLLEKAEIPSLQWANINNLSLRKLSGVLAADSYQMSGKTTFKEEFVTCGGVMLNQINLNTMEHKEVPGLHFAGEVLNIDGLTGGFNFQAAWSTAFISATALSK